MIVVSDASPLNVLVRIGHVGVLHDLFGSVIVPPAVASELSHASTPEVVRIWFAQPPNWLTIRAPLKVDATLEMDDRGEVEAISLRSRTRIRAQYAESPRCFRSATPNRFPGCGTHST